MSNSATNSLGFLIFLVCTVSVFGDYSITLTSNAPVVVGAEVTFHAQLYYNNQKTKGLYKFVWEDDGLPRHVKTNITNTGNDTWVVPYPAGIYHPGPYEVQVVVYGCEYILGPICSPWEETSRRLQFDLSSTLNGELEIDQNGHKVDSKFVSNAVDTDLTVKIKQSDLDYINASATSILTYWFVDCKYIGPTDTFSYSHKFADTDTEHSVEAIVMAGYEPITTTTTSTTTTSTTTTTTTTKPTTTTTKTTSKPTTTSTTTRTTTAQTTTKPPKVTTANVLTTSKSAMEVEGSMAQHRVQKRNAPSSGVVARLNGILMPSVPSNKTTYNGSFPFICGNNTIVPRNHNSTYGYFSRRIIPKAPVSNVTVNGVNWIKHDQILSLMVTCHGSGMFNACIHFFPGEYNITGNETCIGPDTLEKCEIPINRYFSEGNYQTVVVVIYNDVNKVITPVAVRIYEVTTQPQLSVIVVPVTASLFAFILVIFGIAYYIQNRSSFIVEVADFNFGQTYSDMECKSFRERLRESIINAFTRVPSPSPSEIWPPNRNYGSMTS